ncbi:hypothetical protein LTR84_006967 [Exophiala bonariae]|uniref:DUF7791 domain-containing protein n=1 Tax=Exophiala bonariae TaxID=1690606 RepID=A0AAV9N2F9_9EURO|nr:hypothetical protein LTR84_006967 [Exophiala bonariae]
MSIGMGIEKKHRAEAFLPFNIAQTMPSSDVLSLSFLADAFQDSSAWNMSNGQEFGNEVWAVARHQVEQTTRRSNTKCKGLLEVHSHSDGGLEPWMRPFAVDFLHRTVKDFLASRAMPDILDAYSPPQFDAWTLLSQATFAQLKMIDCVHGSFNALVNMFLQHLRSFEVATGKTSVSLIDYFVLYVNPCFCDQNKQAGKYDFSSSTILMGIKS